MRLAQFVGGLRIASGAGDVLELVLIGGVVIRGEELGEHLRGLGPGGMGAPAGGRERGGRCA